MELIKIEKMKILGYLTLYFKVTSDKQIAYAKLDNDFRKPLDEQFFERIKLDIALGYQELGMDVTSVEFCDKEEYELNNSKETSLSYTWDDRDSNIQKN